MPAIKKAKVSKASEKVEGEKKPKRKAALGTLAWTAYVKHCKTTMPDSFEGLTKESEKLVIVKGIRAEDPEGYASFTEAWKAEHAETASVSDASSAADAASVSDAETASVAEEPVPEPVAVKKVAKAAPKAAPKPAEKPAAAPKAAAAKPAAAKPAAAAAAKPAPKAVKTVKKVVKEEVPSMPQREIDGTNYWHDPESNGLWEVTGETVADGTGSWIGYFQPGNEEEPIRFTEAFGSD